MNHGSLVRYTKCYVVCYKPSHVPGSWCFSEAFSKWITGNLQTSDLGRIKSYSAKICFVIWLYFAFTCSSLPLSKQDPICLVLFVNTVRNFLMFLWLVHIFNAEILLLFWCIIAPLFVVKPPLINFMFPSHMQGIHKRMVWFQKLTRNLFLTLHGHNVHRQQRELSKFLMCY